MLKILGLIPARGGSKGIKHKNLRDFAGLPLIAHTIKVAQQSRLINRIVVSTDDHRIATAAKQAGAEVPILRPKNLASDQSKVTDAVVHLLNYLKQSENYSPDFIFLLQATSPLRESADITGAFKLLQKCNADAVVSVCATEQLLYTKDKSDKLKLVSDKNFLKTSNRQQLPPTYKLDGSMIYLIKTKVFLKEKTFLPKNTVGYEIPRWRAVDLDEPQDFVVGEMIYQNRTTLAKKISTFK